EFIKPYVNNVSGDIVTASGKKIGRHAGLDFYTIGQRKGVGVGGTGPYYVAKKDYKTSTLVVAPKGEASALESKSVIVCQTSFIGDEPSEKVEIQAAIRYRQEPVPTVLSKVNNDKWRVDFEKSVRAVAPGQSAVFYRGEELLGGGIID
ncbi:MAG: tRNA 2-thiouridine(34) synthase MnmA, partial [Candidatus Sungbacteria bacterium]|nr:tRNA 2-thiouridine(34) synthase MnmA [Candidatus Sungbacteria bacterium]